MTGTGWELEFVAELKAHGARTIMPRYEELTGRTRKTLYEVARRHGWTSGRKKRSDAGELKSGMTERQIELIAGLMYTTRRRNKGPIMPAEVALEIAADNGYIERGQISVARLNAILRERTLSKAHMMAPEPYTEMRSLHPNHVHAFDVSVCIQYYLPNGKTAIIDERDFYKNKLDNIRKIKTRLHRYALVDHFSGAFFVWYFDTSGESQKNLYDFLLKAWAGVEDENHRARYPFRGVPYLVLMDRGAANTARAVVAFLERLGVEIPKGNPYNPRRQGSVESFHNIWERHFESLLRIEPAQTVGDINVWALDKAIYLNGKKPHTRHGMPRTQCWLLITNEQLRELPEPRVLKDLYANPEEERTVDGRYAISFRGKEYLLKHIPGLYSGAKVRAVLKPWVYPVIEVRYKDAAYEAEPIEKLDALQGGFSANAAIIGQEYRSQPETGTQKAIKRIENMAYGENPGSDARPFDGLIVHGIHAEKLGPIAMIPRTGQTVEVMREYGEARQTIMKLFRRLAHEGIAVTPSLNEELRGRYPDGVTEADIEAVINELLAPGAEERIAL